MGSFFLHTFLSIFSSYKALPLHHSLPDHTVVPQQLLHYGSFDGPNGRLLQQVQGARKLHLQGRLAVHEADRALQQVPDVIDAAPDLRHAPVYAQQTVDCLHGSADGILRGEDGVPGSLGKLTQEGEVHAAVGDHVRPVSLPSGHEEGCDVGQHGWYADGAVLCIFRDQLHRHADVVQPLFGDLLSRAVPHGLLHIVSRHIGKESVYPDADLLRVLLLELALTVDGPAHEPLGVPAAYDAAGDHAAASGIPLADIGDVGQDLIIQGGDGGGLPVGLLDIGAEFFRVSEGGILLCDVLPEVPAAAGADLRVSVGGMVLVPVDGPLRAASIGHEYQVVFRKEDPALHSVGLALDGGGSLLALLDLKEHIGDLRIVAEVHPGLLQVFHHGKDQGLILVVAGKFQGTEVRQSRNVMDEALEIELHFQRTVPVFKGEHGAPVEPEVGVEHLLIENILNGLVIKVLVPGHEELHDLHAALLAEAEFAVGMGVLAPFLRGPAEGVVGIVLIEPVKFIQHRCSRFFQRGDAAEEVPEAFEMVLHLPATPHDVAPVGIVDAVAGASCNVHSLQDVDVGTGHLSVPYQEAGCRQGGKAAAHDVGVLLLHPLRLLRTGKGLVVSAAVVDALAVLFMHAPLRIPVVLKLCCPQALLLLFSVRGLLCQKGCCPCSCQSRCRCSEFSQISSHICTAFLMVNGFFCSLVLSYFFAGLFSIYKKERMISFLSSTPHCKVLFSCRGPFLEIPQGVSHISLHQGGDLLHQVLAVLLHARSDPVQHDPYEAVFVKIRDKGLILLGNGKSPGLLLHHIPDQPVGEPVQVPLHPLPVQAPVGVQNKGLVLQHRLKDLEDPLLPGVIGLLPGQGPGSVRQAGPLHQVVDILEMIIKCHAADAAVRCDVLDGDLIQGLFQHNFFQGGLQGFLGFIGHGSSFGSTDPPAAMPRSTLYCRSRGTCPQAGSALRCSPFW